MHYLPITGVSKIWKLPLRSRLTFPASFILIIDKISVHRKILNTTGIKDTSFSCSKELVLLGITQVGFHSKAITFIHFTPCVETSIMLCTYQVLNRF